MLEDHDEDRDAGSLKVGSVGDETLVAGDSKQKVALATAILKVGEVVLGDSLLEQLLRLDLEVFQLDELRVGGLTSEIGDDLETFGLPALVHEPSRRLGQEHHADGEDNGGDDLDGDGDEPGGFALALSCATDVVGACRQYVSEPRHSP